MSNTWNGDGIQGHSRSLALVTFDRPQDFPVFHYNCLYHVPFPRYYHFDYQNLQRSHNWKHPMWICECLSWSTGIRQLARRKYSTHLIFLVCNSSVLDQLIAVFLQNVRHAADLLVHERLCEHRLINLIVTIATIANLSHVHYTITLSLTNSTKSTTSYHISGILNINIQALLNYKCSSCSSTKSRQLQ